MMYSSYGGGGMGGGMAGGGAYGGGFCCRRRSTRRNGSRWQWWQLLRCPRRRLHSLRRRLRRKRSGFAGLRGQWPGRLYPGDYVQVRRLWRRFRPTPSRFHLPDHDVLSFELVAPDPTSSVAFVGVSDVATIRLRIWLRTVGDHLVSSPTGVLLLDDGKGLQHHSSPCAPTHQSTHTISNTPAHSAADSTTDSASSSASHKAASTQRTS